MLGGGCRSCPVFFPPWQELLPVPGLCLLWVLWCPVCSQSCWEGVMFTTQRSVYVPGLSKSQKAFKISICALPTVDNLIHGQALIELRTSLQWRAPRDLVVFHNRIQHSLCSCSPLLLSKHNLATQPLCSRIACSQRPYVLASVDRAPFLGLSESVCEIPVQEPLPVVNNVCWPRKVCWKQAWARYEGKWRSYCSLGARGAVYLCILICILCLTSYSCLLSVYLPSISYLSSSICCPSIIYL